MRSMARACELPKIAAVSNKTVIVSPAISENVTGEVRSLIMPVPAARSDGGL
jgi:hypothetical protein